MSYVGSSRKRSSGTTRRSHRELLFHQKADFCILGFMYRYIIRLFWEHSWRHPLYVLGIMLVGPLTFLFHQFLPPLIVSEVLNRLIKGDFVQGDFFGSFGSTLLLYVIVFMVGNMVLWRLLNYLTWRLELLVARELAQRVFNHLVQLDATFHSNQFAGSLVSQTTKLLSAYTRMAETTVLIVGGLAMSFLFTTIILLPRVPYFVLSLYGLAIIYIVIALVWSKRIRKVNIAEAQMQSRQTGQLADSLGNILAIKSFAAQGYENLCFSRTTDETYEAGLNLTRTITRRNSYFAAMGSAFSITSVIMAIASVMFWRADVATVYLLLVYGLNVVQKLWDFNSTALREYDRAFGDAHDMGAILQRQPTVTDPSRPLAAKIASGKIEFAKVGFRYSQAHSELFSDFTLTIKPGEKIGLVGHSGAGKTTLTKLLLRFIDVNQGHISIDGQDISHLNQVDLHSAIAYVPQEPLLFHRSIRENIAYGKPDATDREIRAVAARARALDFINELPQGLDTLVGERGVKLSGGQRQRIAIARAMLKDAPILVLDEATSALDSISEKAIQAALFELMEGRTTVAIAHRLSTIQHLDRIVVLDSGKIIEQGTHQQLLARDGLYAELWHHQSGGFIEAHD